MYKVSVISLLNDKLAITQPTLFEFQQFHASEGIGRWYSTFRVGWQLPLGSFSTQIESFGVNGLTGHKHPLRYWVQYGKILTS